LIDGHNTNLFNVSISYENSSIKVIYIRKLKYDKEYVASLKKKVTNLKEKLSAFSNRINDLIV
jgi:hypothetical protein